MWKVAVTIVNKQAQTTDKGWPSSLGPATPMFERPKTVLASDRAAIETGPLLYLPSINAFMSACFNYLIRGPQSMHTNLHTFKHTHTHVVHPSINLK
jgi:hypothetical protein